MANEKRKKSWCSLHRITRRIERNKNSHDNAITIKHPEPKAAVQKVKASIEIGKKHL